MFSMYKLLVLVFSAQGSQGQAKKFLTSVTESPMVSSLDENKTFPGTKDQAATEWRKHVVLFQILLIVVMAFVVARILWQGCQAFFGLKWWRRSIAGIEAELLEDSC